MEKVSLRDYVLYFLKLGTVGFGGPIALVGRMQKDLVEDKGWVTPEVYKEGLVLSQLHPGPLAAQLAIYLGWARAGFWGATLVGIAFVLPSFLMVIILAALYLHYGGLPWIQKLFYGIGAVVIGIIIQGATKLFKKNVGKDWLLVGLWLVSAGVTIATQSEKLWLFLLCGIVAIFLKSPPKTGPGPAIFSFAPAWLLTGLQGSATTGVLGKILLFFTTSGIAIFGSGLAIVPFLYGGVVEQYQWLNERQFLDAVAVAMITPGPVVITVGFIGYLVAGFFGAVAAAGGTFLPCYLGTVLLAPYFHRYAKNLQVKAFVDGVTAAAVGAITGAAFILGKKAIVDIPTLVILAVACFLLFKVKKVPEPALILLGGMAGYILKSF
jgi:chromate transporter